MFQPMSLKRSGAYTGTNPDIKKGECIMYKIVMRASRVKKHFLGGLSWEAAQNLCESYNWEWMDENGFVWELEIEEDCEYVCF